MPVVSDLISIPQGSIKRVYGVFKVDAVVLFQFHKVRLKDCWRTWRRRGYRISIPQGSIKSEVNEIISRTAKQISIPQGSIKSLGANQSYDDILNISIPQGSIKSQRVTICRNQTIYFNSTRFD